MKVAQLRIVDKQKEVADWTVSVIPGQRLKRVPITVAEWRARLDEDAKRTGSWRLLTREMLNSRAYASLTRGGMIFVGAMLDKLEYEKAGKKDRKGVKQGGNKLRYGGRFGVTNNELKARGLKSEKAIHEARMDVWEKGFYDTVQSGNVTRSGKSQYSERWKVYPHGAYKPIGQPRPGECLYPHFKKKGSESTVESAVSTDAESAVSTENPVTVESAVKEGQNTPPQPGKKCS